MPTKCLSQKHRGLSRSQERVLEQPLWHFPTKKIETSVLQAQQPVWGFPVKLNLHDSDRYPTLLSINSAPSL